MPREFPFKIGADPEFNFSIQKRMIHANNLLNNIMAGKGIQKEMGYKFETGEIGWDGYNATAELRPKAEKNPLQLANNIGQLISKLSKETAMMELRTSSELASTGGHIHLEIPNDSFLNKEKIQCNGMNEPDIVRALKMVCSFMLPIILGEDLLNSKIRNNKGYGQLFDARIHSPSPSVATLEIRQPSAEWLTCSKTTEAILAYMAVVWNEVLYHQVNLQKNKELLITRRSQGNVFSELTGDVNSLVAKTCLRQIKKAVKTFDAYNDFKEQVDFILNPKAFLKEKEKANYDIITGWNMGEKITLKDLTKKQKNLNDNMEKLTRIIHFNFNDEDYNMATMIDELKKVIINQQWKMKNTYAFYGLNKSIPNYVVSGRTVDNKHSYYTQEMLTQETLERIERGLGKMEDKLGVRRSTNVFLIGIPHEERKRKDIKSLIKLIYNIENNKITLSTINENLLPHATQEKTIEIEKEAKEDRKVNILAEDVTRAENSERARRERELYCIDIASSPLNNGTIA
jgi:hypothetical protein